MVYSCRGTKSIVVVRTWQKAGRAWSQELKAAHSVSTFRKQRVSRNGVSYSASRSTATAGSPS